jgi:hypothetical protein
MEKSHNKTQCGKYDKKCYSYKGKRQSKSDPSSESDEHIKSHHSRSRVHKHRHHHSRSSVNNSIETQSIEHDGERCNSKEERVAGEPDKKRWRSYDDRYKVESQKESCDSEDDSGQLEFSFQKYYYDLKVFLRDEDLVPDAEDFWKFLKNYETVQKRAVERKHDLGSAGKKEL